MSSKERLGEPEEEVEDDASSSSALSSDELHVDSTENDIAPSHDTSLPTVIANGPVDFAVTVHDELTGEQVVTTPVVDSNLHVPLVEGDVQATPSLTQPL